MSNFAKTDEIIAIMRGMDSARVSDRFDTRVESNINNIKDLINKSDTNNKKAHVNDGYGNTLLSIGNDDKSASFSDYTWSNSTMNYPLWTALYNDSWVFKRAIDKPAQDMIRTGIKIQGDFNKEQILRELKSHRSDFIQLIKWGRLYGGSIAVMMFDNLESEDYAKRMNLSKIRQSKTCRFYVVDRFYGVDATYDNTVTNMNSFDYGKPKFYNVTLADGKTFKFHHDYVLRFENRNAPKLIKNGMLMGWGYAEGSHILNELTRDEKLKTSIQSLIDKSLIEVIKMSGMRGLFMGTDPQNEAQIKKRLEMVNWGRNFNSLTFLDKDDDYNMNAFTGLSGLSQILEANMWQIAAALEMQGVLFGDLKQGFSNDAEALERYDETINGLCEDYLRPVFEKYLTILFKKYNIKEKIEFEFGSLISYKKDEDSMKALNNLIDTCHKLMDDGIITPQQYAKTLQTYTLKGTIDFSISDEDIENLKDRVEEEMEDIDLDGEDSLDEDDEDLENIEQMAGPTTPAENKGETQDANSEKTSRTRIGRFTK